MKVSIIAAVTADGFIAKASDHMADWTSPEDKKRFVALTREAGVMIMGSSTFDTIGRPLPGRKTVVYTTNPSKYAGVDILTTKDDPKVLLEKLEAEGYSQVAICGGAHIYDLFIQSGFVTDIYLTVEPVLFGQGLTLFTNPTEYKLELVAHEKLNDNTVATHYRVLA
nr:Dihydrofolate reductase [uncultured bacterium]AIA13945.1 Dihydrofolate reductase [uncultured bacterium]